MIPLFFCYVLHFCCFVNKKSALVNIICCLVNAKSSLVNKISKGVPVKIAVCLLKISLCIKKCLGTCVA
jgi:hypothetical protein